MIPTFNCAPLLRETLHSVISQDPGAHVMQIEVVDDHSQKDDPEEVVNQFRGRVSFYRQHQNVGYIRNFNTCIQRARGHVVHILHGDDYVLDGFYDRLQPAFLRDKQIGAAFCRSIYLGQQGQQQSLTPLERPDAGLLPNWLEIIATRPRLTTPSLVVRREVYESLGGFDDRFRCAGEDWEMCVRIATRYDVWFEPEPLAVYRVARPGSLMDSNWKQTRTLRDMKVATEIIESYLPGYLDENKARRSLNWAAKLYLQWARDGFLQSCRDRDWVNGVRFSFLALSFFLGIVRRRLRSVQARLSRHPS
jgi:glycosyltransferase involved in cell wall biosynthesis